MAAISVANRVASELRASTSAPGRLSENANGALGGLVGYSVRFDDCSSESTRIKFLTDGMLLREALLDKKLRRYSVIVIDEAHERTVNTDVLLGLVKRLMKKRPKDLKVIIMSATLNARKFQTFFSSACGERDQQPTENGNKKVTHTSDIKNAFPESDSVKAVIVPVLYIRGRQFPVQVMNTTAPEPDYLEACLLTVLQINEEQTSDGGILVFLTGQEEIDSLCRLLEERSKSNDKATRVSRIQTNGCKSNNSNSFYHNENMREVRSLHIVRIYAALPYDDQMKVFEAAPIGSRKIVLATNIAETSLTIPGIKYVVDTGLVKSRSFNPRSGVQALHVVPISKAQAAQRCGRAGRDSPGVCYRLYTENSFFSLEDSTAPEILRCGLATIILQLKALGVTDVMDFDFIDPPSTGAILKALEMLLALGAIDSNGDVVEPLGRQMAALPLDPMPARTLVASIVHGCSDEVCAIMALLSVENLFYVPSAQRVAANAAHQQFDGGDGDAMLLVKVMNAWKTTPKRERTIWCRHTFLNKRSLEKAVDIEKQLQRHLKQIIENATISPHDNEFISSKSNELHSDPFANDCEKLRRCMAEGFFLNAARRLPDGRYRCLSSGIEVHMHPSSTMFGKKAESVLFNELVETSKKYIRIVTPIDQLWLLEIAPMFFTEANARLS